jgi:hypothetical protein|tara:strand:- start:12842 stop:13075 length:234 start_codon:yes stop_codon:yes gene_type:complete
VSSLVRVAGSPHRWHAQVFGDTRPYSPAEVESNPVQFLDDQLFQIFVDSHLPRQRFQFINEAIDLSIQSIGHVLMAK